MQGFRELDRIAMTAHVHVEHRDRGTQEVIVNRRDPDAPLDQPFHDGTDLAVAQDQVPHEHGALPRPAERRPSHPSERWFDGDPIDGDVKIRAREGELVNPSRQIRALLSDRLIHRRPVDLGRRD